MKISIITIAGISSRFNEGIPENEKVLKAVYFEKDNTHTLLYHLLLKCTYADKIVIVSGYKADAINKYLETIDEEIREKIIEIYNPHFADYGSGYSLYLGLNESMKYNPEEILFVEGDLDIDDESFNNVVKSPGSVLTYSFEPIIANKAVVLYVDANNRYRYAFNSNHGLLTIDSPFASIYNSGQVWKFTEMEKLKKAADSFFKENKEDTNLAIIQNYLDEGVNAVLVPLKRWTNCNTRDDYKKILGYWENKQ